MKKNILMIFINYRLLIFVNCYCEGNHNRDDLDENEYDNYRIVLNNSRDPFKHYFTLFDLKKILNHDIDYTLSEELYLKDMDKYIMEGIIVTLDKHFPDYFFKDYKTYLTMATDVFGGDENE